MCNFTCEHCFNYIENKKRRNNLSLEEIEKISKNLGHLKYVTLAGGEPMIRNDVFEIIKIFKKNNGLQMVNINYLVDVVVLQNHILVHDFWFFAREIDRDDETPFGPLSHGRAPDFQQPQGGRFDVCTPIQ